LTVLPFLQAKLSKGIQSSPVLKDSSTQTDWEADVPDLHVSIDVPPPADSSFAVSDISAPESEEWLPDSESEEEEEEDESDTSYPSEEKRRFIVFEDNLDLLLNICQTCGQGVSVDKRVNGSSVKCYMYCQHCCEERTWSSQPCSGLLATGHLELAAAIMFSGSSPYKLLRALKFAGIRVFTTQTYFNIQKVCNSLPLSSNLCVCMF